MSAADQLEFLTVLPVLMPCLIETLSAENCLNRLALATRRSLGTLAARAVQVADEHFETLAASHAFNPLPEEALTTFLKCETLTAPEVDLYQMLVAWHAHDPSRSFEALLEHISLDDLGVKFLLDAVMPSPLVISSARARDLVRDAMGRLTLPPAERAQLPSPSTTVQRKRVLHIDLRLAPSAYARLEVKEGGKRSSAGIHIPPGVVPSHLSLSHHSSARRGD